MMKYKKQKRLTILLIFFAAFIGFSCLPYAIPLPTYKPTQTKEQLVSPTGHFVQIDGNELYYEDAGPQDAAHVLVLIHGFGGNTFSWRYTTPYFTQRGYRVIAVDLLGYGLSDKPYNADYSHPAQAARVKVIMDRLGIQQATVFGHSMGGSVVTHFAHRYPERVTGLVLVDPALFTQSQFRIQGTGLQKALLVYPPVRRYARILLRAYLTGNRAQTMLTSAYGEGNPVLEAALQGYADRNAVGQWDEALLVSLRDMNRNTLLFPLSELTLPTLILSGDRDVWVPTETTKARAAEFGNAQFVLIPNAGHLPAEEQPDILNQTIIQFLETNHL
jgi:pimeloyl-ACP methyl ester carboxylesterase